MLRTIVRLTPTFSIPLFEHRSGYDRDNLKTPHIHPQTGWERVKCMYTRNEVDEFNPAVHTIAQSSLCGAFFGACLGGFAKSRDAYLYFIENNQATIFKSTMEAKKKLQDYVTVAFAKGAYHWGWRLGCFTGLFTAIATTISVYHDETSISEYIAAGTLTGGIFRVHLGLAATIVGAGLGATLSLIAGTAVLGILKVTGVSMEDIWKALYTIKEAREEQYRQAVEKTCEIKNDKLTKHHESLVAQHGEQDLKEL